MSCKNTNIQELLPAFAVGNLDQSGRARVEDHLAACTDCAREAALLSMMAGDPVPDPGESFWAEMPERVYQAVQQQNRSYPRQTLSELFHLLVLPRWAWAAAAAGIVLVVSWAVVNPLQRHAAPVASGEEYSYDEVASPDPVLRHTSATIADLTPSELDSAGAWAATEFSAIAIEAGTTVVNVSESDLSEELEELNAREVNRLSALLQEPGKEG